MAAHKGSTNTDAQLKGTNKEGMKERHRNSRVPCVAMIAMTSDIWGGADVGIVWASKKEIEKSLRREQ